MRRVIHYINKFSPAKKRVFLVVCWVIMAFLFCFLLAGVIDDGYNQFAKLFYFTETKTIAVPSYNVVLKAIDDLNNTQARDALTTHYVQTFPLITATNNQQLITQFTDNYNQALMLINNNQIEQLRTIFTTNFSSSFEQTSFIQNAIGIGFFASTFVLALMLTFTISTMVAFSDLQTLDNENEQNYKDGNLNLDEFTNIRNNIRKATERAEQLENDKINRLAKTLHKPSQDEEQEVTNG